MQAKSGLVVSFTHCVMQKTTGLGLEKQVLIPSMGMTSVIVMRAVIGMESWVVCVNVQWGRNFPSLLSCTP